MRLFKKLKSLFTPKKSQFKLFEDDWTYVGSRNVFISRKNGDAVETIIIEVPNDQDPTEYIKLELKHLGLGRENG